MSLAIGRSATVVLTTVLLTNVRLVALRSATGALISVLMANVCLAAFRLATACLATARSTNVLLTVVLLAAARSAIIVPPITVAVAQLTAVVSSTANASLPTVRSSNAVA